MRLRAPAGHSPIRVPTLSVWAFLRAWRVRRSVYAALCIVVSQSLIDVVATFLSFIQAASENNHVDHS